MSEPLDDEAEVIDGLPVLGEEPAPAPVERPSASSRALALRFAAPVQATAAAVGGFLAGIAVVGILSRRNGRRRGVALLRRPKARTRRTQRRSHGVAGDLVQVVASRSLLVDVHLLGSSRDER